MTRSELTELLLDALGGIPEQAVLSLTVSVRYETLFAELATPAEVRVLAGTLGMTVNDGDPSFIYAHGFVSMTGGTAKALSVTAMKR